MIKATFRLGGDVLDTVVDGNNVMFTDASGIITTIEGIRLSMSGVIKEHPDLEGDKDWKLKAIKRFKIHVKKMKTEIEKINYIKNELKNHGYFPMHFQQAGHRPKKFNGD